MFIKRMHPFLISDVNKFKKASEVPEGDSEITEVAMEATDDVKHNDDDVTSIVETEAENGAT